MKKKTVKSKGRKIKAKIIFGLCLALFAAALITALIVIDQANDKPGGGNQGTTGSSIPGKVELPPVDLSDMINGK